MTIDQLELFVLAPNSTGLSADAIVFRYGEDLTDRDSSTVVVVDSGRQASTGGKVQDIVESVFETEKIDLVVSTHADKDHAGGIPHLLTNMHVGEVGIHRPQNHRPLEPEPIAASIRDVNDILTTAQHREIPVHEPFSDSTVDRFAGLHVLGPSKAYYQDLMDRGLFDTQELDELDEIDAPVQASLGDESPQLLDSPTTSLRNNSSTIILLRLESKQLLLTADAGVEAFESARETFGLRGYDPANAIVQLPHHGSRRNLNLASADLLLGQVQGETRSFVTAAVDDRFGFPHVEITDAFIRAGRKIPSPTGQTLRYHHNCPIESPDAYEPISEDRYIVASWER